MVDFERFEEYMENHLNEDSTNRTIVDRDDRKPSPTVYRGEYTFDNVQDGHGVYLNVDIEKGRTDLEERDEELEDRTNNNDIIERPYKEENIDLTDKDGTLYEITVEDRTATGDDSVMQAHIMLYRTDDGEQYVVHNDVAIKDRKNNTEQKYEIRDGTITGPRPKDENRNPFRDDANYRLENGLQQTVRNLQTLTEQRLDNDHDDGFMEEIRLYTLRQAIKDFIDTRSYREHLQPG
ncbi:MAG: hypothetical protein SVU32_06845 [Candidatus Nanohaloarchaea archaeon]|nr:hypothetical protein [Candidatus Nanohaloarchaea archaeon]